MSDLPPLRYARPGTLRAALTALARPGACVYAGGTDLLVALGERRRWARFVRELVDVKGIDDARGVGRVDGALRIGALATAAELADDATVRRHAPALAEAARLTSAPALRGRGTVGGNLVTPHPAGDVTTALVALDAIVEVASGRGIRLVPIVDFLAGQEVAWPKQCLVLAVRLARQPASAFEKIADRAAFGRALVAAAVVARGREVRVALGGLGSRPFLAPRTGNAVRRGDGLAAALAAECRPVGDGEAGHRLTLAAVVVERARERSVA
jgi:CO/xanthine dehydrogenase FAD-binding subunit